MIHTNPKKSVDLGVVFFAIFSLACAAVILLGQGCANNGHIQVIPRESKVPLAAYYAPAGSATIPGADAFDGRVCIAVVDGNRLVFVPLDHQELREVIQESYEKQKLRKAIEKKEEP